MGEEGLGFCTDLQSIPLPCLLCSWALIMCSSCPPGLLLILCCFPLPSSLMVKPGWLLCNMCGRNE